MWIASGPAAVRDSAVQTVGTLPWCSADDASVDELLQTSPGSGSGARCRVYGTAVRARCVRASEVSFIVVDALGHGGYALHLVRTSGP